MNDIIVSEIMNGVTALAFGLAIIICAAWIVINVVAALRQRTNTRTRAEIYNRLIDKFGTAPEFIDFLKSDAGLQFIEENTAPDSVPLTKILGSIQLGVILALLGAGLLILGNIFGGSLGGDLYIVLTVGGTVGVMVGAGFLISAGISYKLCRTWGILAPAKEQAKA